MDYSNPGLTSSNNFLRNITPIHDSSLSSKPTSNQIESMGDYFSYQNQIASSYRSSTEYNERNNAYNHNSTTSYFGFDRWVGYVAPGYCFSPPQSYESYPPYNMQYPANGRTSGTSECIPIISNHSCYGSLPYQATPSNCKQLNNNGYTLLTDRVKLEITHGKPTKGMKKSLCIRPTRQENWRKPGIMKHQCPVCLKIFSRQYNLNSHLKIHTKERPYICKYGDCTWTFARPHDLKRHQLLHSGIKPFSCICGKRFSRSDAYKRHLKTNVDCLIMTACMSFPTTSY